MEVASQPQQNNHTTILNYVLSATDAQTSSQPKPLVHQHEEFQEVQRQEEVEGESLKLRLFLLPVKMFPCCLRVPLRDRGLQ